MIRKMYNLFKLVDTGPISAVSIYKKRNKYYNKNYVIDKNNPNDLFVQNIIKSCDIKKLKMIFYEQEDSFWHMRYFLKTNVQYIDFSSRNAYSFVKFLNEKYGIEHEFNTKNVTDKMYSECSDINCIKFIENILNK